MKRTFLQVATLTLVGLAVVLQTGCSDTQGSRVLGKDQVAFDKIRCYLTTISDGTVTASDTLVCTIQVGDAGPGDTTDVEKK